jgi:hypothetical protein
MGDLHVNDNSGRLEMLNGVARHPSYSLIDGAATDSVIQGGSPAKKKQGWEQ